jgi:hypothetical protein
MLKELENRMIDSRDESGTICVKMIEDSNVRGERFKGGSIVEVDRQTGSCLIYLGKAQRVRKSREGK